VSLLQELSCLENVVARVLSSVEGQGSLWLLWSELLVELLEVCGPKGSIVFRYKLTRRI
jgi:hypothetical protein